MPAKRALRTLFSDVKHTVAALAIAGITSLYPARYDPRVCNVIANFVRAFKRRRIARMARTLADVHDDLPPNTLAGVAEERVRVDLEIVWARGRALGLQPSVPAHEIEGIEHVHRAIRNGYGAILWRMSFGSASAINAALYDEGFPITHLSTPTHLCRSDGWFARRIASPLFSRDEACYLADRVIMEPGHATGYLPRLKAALADNRVISIVGDADRGRVRESVIMGKRRYSVPSGAPSLSYSTDAALLPCVAVRIAPFRYRIEIHEDVRPDTATDRRAFRQEAITRYSELRQMLSARYPSSDLFF